MKLVTRGCRAWRSCSLLAGVTGPAHHSDLGQVRRHQAADAQRHRHARGLAQSARARLHERARTPRASWSTGRSSSRARSICSDSGWNQRLAAARRRDHGRRHPGAQRQPAGLGATRSTHDAAPASRCCNVHADAAARAAREAADAALARQAAAARHRRRAALRATGRYPELDGARRERRQRRRWTSAGC